MTKPVKTRKYDGSGRRAAAAVTRRNILAAARELFAAQGYAATSVAGIAAAAGVSTDTVYTSVGRKPQLLLAVHDMELAGTDEPVEATSRDYVRAIRAAVSARDKISTYAGALADVLPRTVPLLNALRAAGAREPECQQVWQQVIDRRAANMELFAADLRATGEVRDDLDDGQVAELVWSMNGPEYFTLLASRGRTPGEYAALLTDVWTRVLLD